MTRPLPELPAGVYAVEVPREVVNADSVYVIRWAVADGDRVGEGAPLCELETSKAVVTVESPVAGHARPVAAAGEEVPVGGILAYVTDRPDTPLPDSRAGAGAPATIEAGATRLSAKAQKKIAELGLDMALFAGHAFVREEDVLALAGEVRRVAARGSAVSAEAAAKASGAPDPTAGDDGERVVADARGPSHWKPMGMIQRRVARVMGHSIAAIPASSLERSIDLALVRDRARALGGLHKCVVSEVDLLVHALARTCRDFQEFNGYATADHRLCLFEQVNVGVAVDAAGDLYVVVVRDAARREPQEIAKELRSLQYLAARGRLGVEQVRGGTVTVTSMLGRGVHRFVPIPYPEQAAIVSLADAEPGSTRAALGVVFDHRVANGARAAAFLARVAVEFEAGS